MKGPRKDCNSSEPKYSITLLNVTILMYHMFKGLEDPEIGFEDKDRSLKQLIRALSKRKFAIRRSVLESALWSCTMMDESGKFWNPEKGTYKDFIYSIIKTTNKDFNSFYNLFLEKKKEYK